MCFISELLYPWVTSSGKSVEALSSPGRGWVCSRPCTTLINAQSKSRFGFFLWRVGTSDILLDAVRSCVPSTFIGRSVDIEAVALGNSVSVHYTVDLGSTNFSIPNLSIYPRPSSSSRPAPSRHVPVTDPCPPSTTLREREHSIQKVCIFHHVICSSANLLSVMVTLSYWLHVKPLSRYVVHDQSDTHLPGINNLHKTYSLLLVFAEASLKSSHGTNGSPRNAITPLPCPLLETGSGNAWLFT